jgi:hypothetical protein
MSIWFQRDIVNKRLRIPAVFILVVSFIASTGCISDEQISREAAGPFIQLTQRGIEDADLDITKINQQLYEAEVRLLKMEQVIAPALKWVEYQKNITRRPGSWNVQVTQEGLSQLNNDQYQVTTLELLSSLGNTGIQISYSVRVTDLRTRTVYDWKSLQDDLLFWKASFEQKRQDKLQGRTLSISTLESILKSVQGWNITRVNDSTYIISSPMLGWNNSLTGGTWTYYRDKRVLEAADSTAETLKNILLVK